MVDHVKKFAKERGCNLGMQRKAALMLEYK